MSDGDYLSVLSDSRDVDEIGESLDHEASGLEGFEGGTALLTAVRDFRCEGDGLFDGVEELEA